ncbi:helix-turn-helix domain-containing protein [Clostridium sporogenes]|uniref:helix-turn-helix domain-containing protein n=1 Tax=Clostridium sporogenes TaxID=1509 RepID=UPI0005F02415|nr:helix-turn-helix transcriptional regulator [Clostridium sporogenes]MCW6061579.1 helix-turn-helix transcriptional regulator [Clostridium sporogenes]MCW6069771.1 helix-turn-helix transcriptional regulator [Clostridium sporogenes]MCW6122500.1 helix-turn-helix transcriptional regulator [Clostridium sporogenes]NFF78351.1 helix-turn-helix transcriptional regulator [Clostridium sporogenes]NFU88884.1 helix-turn-helix transcriptional regulator [Clostridium sporogenes]
MLGDNIRRIRKSQKISINKLASMSGVSLGYLSDIENNNAKNPTMDKLQAIADALGIQVSDLLSDKEKLEIITDSAKKIHSIAKEATEKYGVKEVTEKQENKIKTLAAHFEGEEFTDEDVEDIENFIKFIISKKNK